MNKAILLHFVFLLAASAGVVAQEPPRPVAGERKPAVEIRAPAEKKAPEPGAAGVPLADVPAQAEYTSIILRDIEAALAAGGAIAAIEADLPHLSREIDVRYRETARILAQFPSLQLLDRLQADWQRLREAVLEYEARLEQRAARLDRDRKRLHELQASWRETLRLAGEAGEPDLIRRVKDLLAATGGTLSAVEKQQALALKLHGRVTAQNLRIAEALERVRQERDLVLSRLLQRDSPPVWSPAAREGSGRLDSAESWHAQRATLETYVARHADRLVLHAVLLLLLAAFLYRVRAHVAASAAANPALERVARVFSTPLATAIVLSFIGAPWIYPQAPRLLWVIISAAALIPTIEVLRPIVEPRLRLLLYAVLAFFVFDQARAVMAAMEGIPRFLFLAEMIAGALLLLVFLSARRGEPAGSPAEARRIARRRAAARVGCVIFAAAAAANAAGYVTLGYLLGNALLAAAYFGVVLYAMVRILDGLATVALQSPPLNLLGMVRRHGAMLRRRTHRLLVAAAGVWWSLFVLERLALREPVLAAVSLVLTAELRVGSFSLALGEVLSFALVVWGAFLVSRLLRFFLEEDVYPRSGMQRGLHYAVSRTLHYLILVAGFFFAVALLGFDMTKFTILAGAFTVGVGFGLQNIFNNFASGMILLFERPMQVGDMIQIDDTSGIVERIGIRASVVRATSGAEIIVPNGKLISERLVNWTLSAHRRGLDLPMAVANGADPGRVIGILERVAAAHPRVEREPPPEALFTRLGPDWMGFELRAYTADVENWTRVRSDLAVAVSEALKKEGIAMK